MEELVTGVNWTGVIVGAGAAFLLGWLWYTPMLFGKQWAAAHGLKLTSASGMPARAMFAQLVALLLVSWFVGVTAVSSSLATAILALLGFSALYDACSMFAKIPAKGRGINLGYWIVSFVLMIVAQGIF